MVALAARGAAPPDYTALAKGNSDEACTNSEDEGGGPGAGQRRLGVNGFRVDGPIR